MLRSPIHLLISGLFAVTQPAAATIEWIGSIDSDWTKPGNWAPRLPLASDTVVISGGLGTVGTVHMPVITVAATHATLVTISGITVTVSGSGNLGLTSNCLIAGGSDFVVQGSAARLNCPDILVGGNFLSSGEGTLSIRSGAIVTAAAVGVGSDELNTGSIEILSSGTLATSGISRGSGGHVLCDGGRIRAAGASSGFFSGFGAGEIQVGSGGMKFDTQGHAVTLGAGLSGSGGLTKEGSGQLTLTGTHTRSGAITVEAGTVRVSGATLTQPAGGVTVYSDGGSASAVLVENAGTLATSHVFLVGDATLPSSAEVTGAGSSWSINGNLILGTAGLAEMTVDAGGSVSANTATLGGFAGSSGVLEVRGGGVLAVNGLARGAGDALVTLDGGTLRARSDNPAFISSFATGQVVLGVSGGAIDTDGHDVRVGLALTGTGGLSKKGAGTLTLAVPMDFDGKLSVEAGRLSTIGSLVGFPGDGGLEVLAGATFAGGGYFAGDAIIRSGGIMEAGELYFSGALELAGTTVLNVGSLDGPSVHNSKVFVAGSLTLGGALRIECSDTTLPAGRAVSLRLMDPVGDVLSHFDSVEMTGFPGAGTLVFTRAGAVWRAFCGEGLVEFDETTGTLGLIGRAIDSDGDGVSDLFEHAFHLENGVADLSYVPPHFPVSVEDLSGLPNVATEVRPEGNVLVIRYVRRRAATSPGYIYQPQFASDPSDAGGWSATLGEEFVVSIDDTWEHVTAEDAVRGQPRRFGRVALVAP